MRLLNYLHEEYIVAGEKPIYENPSTKELRDACNNDEHECRFFIDIDKKNLYVWDYRQLHEEASDLLKSEGIHNLYPYNGLKELWGAAKLKGTKLKVISLYTIDVAQGVANDAEEEQKLYDKIKFVSRWMDNSLERLISSSLTYWKVPK